ncbi:MAG: S49 family peptidase [Paludibaculum sp.]
MNYPHIAARVFNTPLMIHEGKLQAILSALGPRFAIETPRMDGVEPVDHVPVPVTEEDQAATDGRIHIIDVGGSLINRGAYADGRSGLVSYEWITGEIKRGLGDANVLGIMLRLDSFGGEVSGAFDCADVIREARATKPVWASVDDYAFSAGYLLASQCERIYLTRTSGIGSVGVIAMHADFSRWENNEGITVTVVKFGAKKDDFSPHKPLNKEALAWLQKGVDESGVMFADYVAWGRDMKPAAVIATEAGLYQGQDGIAIGFADQVGTFKSALAEMADALIPQSASNVGGSSASTQKGEVQMSNEKKPAAGAEGAANPVDAQAAAAQPAPAPPAAAQNAETAETERQRIGAVLALPEAEGREQLARELALTPGMSADTAKRLLAVAPQAGAKTNAFAAAMAGVTNPKVGADSSSDASDEQALIASIVNLGKGSN